MAFGKVEQSTSRFGRVNMAKSALGLVHGIGHVLDNPVTGAIVSAVSPEAGAVLAGAKKFGLLEKAKHA